MRLSLIPRKNIFFTQFSQHAQNSLEAAQALEALFVNFTDVEKKVRDIHAIEHYGDKLTHEIMRELNETFVTPLDREDIIGLASKIDDVTDVAYDVSELVLIYKLKSVRKGAARQTQALDHQLDQRLAADVDQRLGRGLGQRPEPPALAAGHDDRSARERRHRHQILEPQHVYHSPLGVE